MIFRKIVINLEIINKYIKELRERGSNLPIQINIRAKLNDIKYFLEQKEVKFTDIKNFLINIKNNYLIQLDRIYNDSEYIRFLFGKHLHNMKNHLENDYNVDSILRYILNNTEHNKKIKNGDKTSIYKLDFFNNYEFYNQNSLEMISIYINSLFKENNTSLEQHYNSMEIIPANKYKGIFLQKCKNNSMEEFIIDLFIDNLKQIPMAQNILITNEETSLEEIQSFLCRAILCKYNTIFAIEINNSFSEHKQIIMNSYIERLITHKNELYCEETEENIEKNETHKYLNSCIVFIYEENNKNNRAFLNQIAKYDIQIFEPIKYDNQIKYKILSQFENVKVFCSECCGLGKSFKIKKLIYYKGKNYFHLLLGGVLTKNIIFNKLENLMNKIKIKDYKNIAVHLDLTETNDISILNEFLFSFLITKFYIHSDNIIYIPNDIHTYIEIPNCFENFFSNFPILMSFNTEYITFSNMPNFVHPNEIINIFKTTLDINSNEKLNEFVRKYIGMEKYTFHQTNIFIKIYIFLFNIFTTKLAFYNNEMDITEEIIDNIAKSITYFTNGFYAKLLTNFNQKEENDKLVDKDDNDLNFFKFSAPLIFVNNKNRVFTRLFISEKNTKEYKNTLDYIKKIKRILNLSNDVEKDIDNKKSLISIINEKDNNYVITRDNYIKILLILYRIHANIPVILMGDTGCGKTILLTKLNQLLNNGKSTIELININIGIIDEKIIEITQNINEKAEKTEEELWLIFDKINNNSSLIKEIFINRTFYGIKICDNIRLIGTCNSFIKIRKNKEILPQSLLYYTFSFGHLDEVDEKMYIYNMIENCFSKEEKYLHELTTEAILQCHIFLRNNFHFSVVSLRDINKFMKCFEFFKDYFTKKK